MISDDISLTDENFGEQLTRDKIYTYRDKGLSIDQYLNEEKKKPKSNRGYLTVSRDTRRLFELLRFIDVLDDNKYSRMSITGKHLLAISSDMQVKEHWKNAFMQMGLEGTDGEISYPYRILLKIVNTIPGIETSKLMLALEAENNSEEEFERIIELSKLPFDEIIQRIGTSNPMAKNAVKILPGIAEQLDDIKRISNKAYPTVQIIVTEDEIHTEAELEILEEHQVRIREVSAENIAKDPSLNIISSANIDLSDAIRIRQKRLVEHQDIVRLLAKLNEENGIKLFESKFDCLGIKDDKALLYEVKTILRSGTDEEKQSVRGVGQLKYYKFSIVRQQFNLSGIKEILVFSMKPNVRIIDFCTAENITVVWRESNSFLLFNGSTGKAVDFIPKKLL